MQKLLQWSGNLTGSVWESNMYLGQSTQEWTKLNLRKFLKSELNIILPRVNNFDIKQKGMEYLFYYMPITPNKIWEDEG